LRYKRINCPNERTEELSTWQKQLSFQIHKLELGSKAYNTTTRSPFSGISFRFCDLQISSNVFAPFLINKFEVRESNSLILEKDSLNFRGLNFSSMGKKSKIAYRGTKKDILILISFIKTIIWFCIIKMCNLNEE
jgi:hypothetical protein